MKNITEEEKNMAVVIDISKHQSTLKIEQIIKWYKAKLINGVIVRATWGTNEDIMFKYFATTLKNADIPFGVYTYSYALSTKSGLNECAKLHEVLIKYDVKPLLPVYIDMEDADHWKEKRGKLSSFPFIDICGQFCSYFENLKYYTGIYANDSWFGSYLKSSKLDKYDKWVANWSTSPRNVSKYGMHQFTNKYRLTGYNDNLDASSMKYDYPAIIKKNGLNGYGEKEEEKEEIIDYEDLYIETRKELEDTKKDLIDTENDMNSFKETLEQIEAILSSKK